MNADVLNNRFCAKRENQLNITIFLHQALAIFIELIIIAI